MNRRISAWSFLVAACLSVGCGKTEGDDEPKSNESDSGFKGEDASMPDGGVAADADVDAGEGECARENVLLTMTDYENATVGYLDTESGNTAALPVEGLDQDTVPVGVGCMSVLLERGTGILRLQANEAPLTTEHMFDLDPEGVDTPYATNAQTVVAVNRTKAYVVPLARNELVVIDPSDLHATAPSGTIDLSPFVSKDDMDGIVEATDAIRVENRVYVALARYWFDASIHFDAGGVLAVIDTETDALVDMDLEQDGIQGIELEGNNPWRGLSYDIARNELWVGVAGDSFAIDGGIEAIDLETGESRGYVLTEETLEAELEGFAIVSTTRVYVKAGTDVVSWNPSTDDMDEVLTDAQGMRVLGGTLYVWSFDGEDASLRLFDTSTGQERTPEEKPYWFGSLPIYDVAAAR